MAKKCSVERNKKRQELTVRYAAKRAALKATLMKKDLSLEDRMASLQKISEMPRNSAETRIRNRCSITGRPRAYYRKFRMSRIALRQLGSQGLIPGLVKASW
jgi:small subunit ribosomal protein S14